MKIFSILQTCKLVFNPLMAMTLAVFLLASCAKENGNVESQTQEPKQEVELRSPFCDDSQYCSNLGNVPEYFDRILVIQGCSIKVKYWVLKCFDQIRQVNVIKFYDLEIKVGQSSACSALLPTLIAGQEVQYNDLLNALHKKVQNQIEAEYMATQSPSGGTQNAVQWLETSCFMYCTRLIIDFEGTSWLEINSVKCGKSCCKRLTSWTRVGDVWVKGETLVEGDPLCSAMATPQNCLGKGTSIGICNVACARM